MRTGEGGQKERNGPDEPKSDNMVGDKFAVVLAGFLEAKDEDEELLAPVGRLNKVVALEVGSHAPMRVV